MLRGIKTLTLRMRQHDQNARRIAQWLASDSRVPAVHYPGLPAHPQHELACRQMSGFGGMLSFETGSLERARRIVERFGVRTIEILESRPERLREVEGIGPEMAASIAQFFREPANRRVLEKFVELGVKVRAGKPAAAVAGLLARLADWAPPAGARSLRPASRPRPRRRRTSRQSEGQEARRKRARQPSMSLHRQMPPNVPPP